MTAVVVTLLHLVVTAAKLCGPGRVRAVIAENLLLKQQLTLAGNTPLGIAAGQQPMHSAELDHVRWVSHCRGLVQLPMAA